jgi:hypothetical protein
MTEEERQAYRTSRRPRLPARPPPTTALTANIDSNTEHHVAFMACCTEADSTSFSHRSSSANTWYVDSGASRYMIGRREWFSMFHSIPAQHWPIKGISATPLYAAGIGDIVIRRLLHGSWQFGHLEDILYIPGLETNLFSVIRVAHCDVHTVCSSSGCNMLLNGALVLQASLQGMMYELLIEVVPPPDVSHALVAASFRSSTQVEERQPLQTWHNRLCHINFSTIKGMANSLLVTGIQLLNDPQPPDLFCEGCCKGKQHRTPFPSNPACQRVPHAGDLIHADLMGPIEPISIGGASYCLLFKDDATGYQILFCIHKKFDTLDCLKLVVQQILCDTGKVVRILCIDRGGEFTSKKALQYYNDALIWHELSALYNPEQNGATERTTGDRGFFHQPRALTLTV